MKLIIRKGESNTHLKKNLRFASLSTLLRHALLSRRVLKITHTIHVRIVIKIKIKSW